MCDADTGPMGERHQRTLPNQSFYLLLIASSLLSRVIIAQDYCMGQASSLGLTQNDVEEVIAYCDGAWNQEEIEGLYKRFRSLDRGRKGYISGDEFLDIPELSINPIASRLVGPIIPSCVARTG